MTWYIILAAVLLLAVAAVAVFTAFRNPTFVAGLVRLVVSAIASAVLPAISKRMPEADEGRMREAKGSGLEWDNARKRPRDR